MAGITKTQRIQLVASPEWVAMVEEWRARQRPVPNFSAAVRRLAELAVQKETRARG